MVQWIDATIEEITEFAGFTDDCGPNANEVALAWYQNRKPSLARMNAIRARDILAGLFKPGDGQNIYSLVADVHRFEPGVVVQQFPATVNFDAQDDAYFEAVRQRLIAALTNHHVCVVNVGNAAVLPGNEGGVEWHFVVIGAIDDAPGRGYLVYNGDEHPFDGQPNWVTWAQLRAARPVGIVEYCKPTQGDIMSNLPTGYFDNGAHITTPTANVVITGGFRAEFLNNPAAFVARYGDPVSNEVSTPNVGDDGAHGGGSEQVFQKGVIGWTAKEGTFQLWSGLMLARERAAFAQSQAQVVAANQNIANLNAIIAQLRSEAQSTGNGNTPRAADAQEIVESLFSYQKTYLQGA